MPFSGLQLSLDINFGALAQVLLGDSAQIFVENDDAVPFCSFTPLACGPILPGFGCSKRQIADGVAVLCITDLWIAAEISYKNDLVDTARNGYI